LAFAPSSLIIPPAAAGRGRASLPDQARPDRDAADTHQAFADAGKRMPSLAWFDIPLGLDH
jgi:hypothetical protein